MAKEREITILRSTRCDGKKVHRGDVVKTTDMYLVRTGAAIEGAVKLADSKPKEVKKNVKGSNKTQ